MPMYRDMPVRKELKLIYSLVKPKYAISIHGEYRHLKANAEVAKSLGIPEGKCIYHSVRRCAGTVR